MNDKLDTTAYYHVAYSRHRIMNPISEERLHFVLSNARLPAKPCVLDVGGGNGTLALLLAKEFDAQVTLVDTSSLWLAKAKKLFDAEGMLGHITFVEKDAAAFLTEENYDLISCLGTTLIYGSFQATLDQLQPMLAEHGSLLIGEATIDRSLPPAYKQYLDSQQWNVPSSRAIIQAIERSGLELAMILTSNRDEWDDYMNLQWIAIRDHARNNPEDAQAQEFLDWALDEQEIFLRYQRHYMDWNVLLIQQSLL